MVTDILNGITACIGADFGKGYKIYTENIEQGLKEPCFFVKVLNPSQNELIGNRWIQTDPFDVHYYPSASNNNVECQNVASRLFYTLKRITLLNGDMLNSFNLHYEIVDNVLHFFVTYKPIIKYKEAAKDTMGSVSVKQKVGD